MAGQTIAHTSLHPDLLAAWEATVVEHGLPRSCRFAIFGKDLEAHVPGGRVMPTHRFIWSGGAWVPAPLR